MQVAGLMAITMVALTAADMAPIMAAALAAATITPAIVAALKIFLKKQEITTEGATAQGYQKLERTHASAIPDQRKDKQMDKEQALKEIEEHRSKIDELDKEILELLSERSRQSLIIRKLKPQAGTELFDPGREQRILDKLDALNKGPMSNDNVHEIYATLLKVMKKVKA